MAIHKKREHGRAAARLLLEATEPVELPPAEINQSGVTIEREEFRPHLGELFAALRAGGQVEPAPVVRNDSIFVIHGRTRTFWVRLWHRDESRAQIDRLHVTSCLPLTRGLRISTGADEEDEDQLD
jgi:hypothetical protein